MSSSAAPLDAVPASRFPLLEQFSAVRRATRQLCAPLTAEDQMVQSTAEASPAKWHQAHTTWFFETFILQPHAPGYRLFNQQYPYLFNSYYKQLGDHPLRTHRGLMSRPGLDEIRAYRAHVDDHMTAFLQGEIPQHLLDLVELGLNHEQQHQELILTDIKHAFAVNPLRPVYAAGKPRLAGGPADLQWIEFEAGTYRLGHTGQGFAFDNEAPRHQVLLGGFRVASRLATNAEYLEFMGDNGYSRPELWLSDGWDAVLANQWQAPLYWERREGQWHSFTLNGMRPIAPQEPVCHISYYEADAFARWSGLRLLTEAEWELAASTAPPTGDFLESGRFHPSAARPRSGLQQMFGGLWQWTASPYTPYPGFHPAAGVLGEYNGKFMCNQLVLRGGSCATPRSHIRASYRNFFPPQTRWQFSGIRLGA